MHITDPVGHALMHKWNLGGALLPVLRFWHLQKQLTSVKKKKKLTMMEEEEQEEEEKKIAKGKVQMTI